MDEQELRRKIKKTLDVYFIGGTIIGAGIGSFLGYYAYKEFGQYLPLQSELVKGVICMFPSFAVGYYSGFIYGGRKGIKRVIKMCKDNPRVSQTP